MNIIEKKKQAMGQGGFTLIELLVVIAILAVLAGLAVIGIGAMRDNAETTSCNADRDTLETTAEAYLINNPTFTTTANNGSAFGSLMKRLPTSGANVTIASGGVVTSGGC